MVDNRGIAKSVSCGKVILLVGAGSSCNMGLSTLDDLLRQAVLGDDEIANLIRETHRGVDAQPARYRPAVFEELIGRIKDYLRIASVLRTDHPFRIAMGQLPFEVDNGALEGKWKQALTRCYRVLLEQFGPSKVDPSSRQSEETVQLLEALTKINSGELHVYTTNYDCSFQVLAAHYTRLAFLTHIHNREDQKGRFTADWHLGNRLASDGASRIYVHRLHGCVAWFNVQVQNGVSGTENTIREVYGAGGRLEIIDDDFLDQMCIKLVADQLVGTNPAFASAYDEFCSHLRQAEVLLIWGYSFRDLEIIRAINHAFSERSCPLRIFYLDPFLNEDTAAGNIAQTLLKTPVHLSPDFQPRKIDWAPPDGFDRLAPEVTKAIQTE